MLIYLCPSYFMILCVVSADVIQILELELAFGVFLLFFLWGKDEHLFLFVFFSEHSLCLALVLRFSSIHPLPTTSIRYRLILDLSYHLLDLI